eukprot:GHRR01013405.1.p1 GENE.GHRR01013405.1~~GHRR01013405.1.p1  ORF type:complete len:701 (+),score=275.86 GHRR01013405.1:195-2297(+)
MAAGSDTPLLAEDLYKHTIVRDYVVRRHVELYRDRFVTYEDLNDPQDSRTYPLDHTAKLSPAGKAEISKKRRHVRPHGVGSMTALAAVRGKGKAIELWTFKLEMEHAWDFRFCFADQDQAYRWHDTLSSVIADLRVSAGLPAVPQILTGTSSSGGGGSGRYSHTTGLYNVSEGGQGSQDGVQGFLTPCSTQDISTHSTQEDEEAELARLLKFQAGSTRRYQQRWVPYRHSNGLAIYQHQGKDSEANEYMVSATIRGHPADVLRALLDPASATTILGPALEVEVLDSSPTRQVLRILLQAVGQTAAWFRPREAVVQVMLKKEEDGVYVLLFSSIGTADAAADSTRLEGVTEAAEGLGGGVRRKNPIRCRVSGGYTVSKLQGYGGADSPESLLTCILQVQDMGGWLNPKHPLFRVVDWWSGGAYEAFLERMLLGGMLVRDVVEKSRFTVKPQVFHTLEGAAASGAVMDDAFAPFMAEDTKAPPLSVLRTSTFVIRQAANQVAAAGSGSVARSNRGMNPAATAAMPHAGSCSIINAAGIKASRLASLRLPDSAAAAMRGRLAGGSVIEGEEEEADAAFRLPRQYYEEIHTPGHDAPFKVRGASYLTDGVKVSAGQPVFELLGMEVIDIGGPGACPHISRYLPCVRRSSKPFLFVFNLMVPGPPTLSCVFVFGSDSHPDALGPPPDDPEESDWQPFDFLMWRCG